MKTIWEQCAIKSCSFEAIYRAMHDCAHGLVAPRELAISTVSRLAPAGNFAQMKGPCLYTVQSSIETLNNGLTMPTAHIRLADLIL